MADEFDYDETESQVDGLGTYFDSIAQLDSTGGADNDEMFRALAAAKEAHDDKAVFCIRQKLAENNLKLVTKLASMAYKKFQVQDTQLLDEFIAAGNLVLMDSIDTYKPGSDYAFATHLWHGLMHETSEIKHDYMRRTNIGNRKTWARARDLADRAAELVASGEPNNPETLANKLGVKPHTLISAQRFVCNSADQIDSAAETVEGPEGDYEVQLLDREMSVQDTVETNITTDSALTAAQLTEQENQALRMYTGVTPYAKAYYPQQIANAMGIDRDDAVQLIKAATKKMKKCKRTCEILGRGKDA